MTDARQKAVERLAAAMYGDGWEERPEEIKAEWRADAERVMRDAGLVAVDPALVAAVRGAQGSLEPQGRISIAVRGGAVTVASSAERVVLTDMAKIALANHVLAQLRSGR